MRYGVGYRGGLDLALLWLWRRPAATAPIRPLAWEPPYAAEAALEMAKRQKKKKKKRSNPCHSSYPSCYSDNAGSLTTESHGNCSVLLFISRYFML